jgi:hypothetical protein
MNMRSLIVTIAGYLGCAGNVAAAEIVLEAGIEAFQVEQPAPAELLSKLGPLLDAAGTEELRVAPVSTYAGNEDLLDGRGRPVDATIWLDQFIAGHEVREGFVIIGLNTRTHEVTLVRANFLPDRGLTHRPRLTEAQARSKGVPQLRKLTEPLAFDGAAAKLAYEFERSGEFGGGNGVLAWVFTSRHVDWDVPYEVSVSSATGRVVGMRSMMNGCTVDPPRHWADSPLN